MMFILLFVILAGPLFAQTPAATPPPIILLYGAKGSGRSTMTVKIQEDFKIPLISLANLLSAHVLDDTSIGKQARPYIVEGGQLPLNISIAILYNRLLEADCHRGVILEENPSSVEQIKAMQECFNQHFCFIAINIEARNEWLMQRFEHRSICRNCGRVYDMPFSPPRQTGLCDICNCPLQRRLDDSPDVVNSRLETYRIQTTPVLNFFRDNFLLTEIPGERNYCEIYKDIVKTIEQKTNLSISQQISLPVNNSSDTHQEYP